MTTIDRRPPPDATSDDLFEIDDFIGEEPAAAPERRGLPRTLIGWLTSTDHKAIGVAYGVTALVFLAIGGALAGIIRAELATPGMQLVDEAFYNQVFTIHGSVMVFLFAVPFGFAIANYLMPLQIGAPDMAFPRLNALSYWLYLFGGIIMLSGFITDGGAAAFGWTAYVPLSGRRNAGAGRRPVDRRHHPHRHVRDTQRSEHHHHDDDDASAPA